MSEPIRLRASSVAELLDCPKRWEQKHLYGLRLPSSPPASVGTAVHKSAAAFDQSVLDGSGLTCDDTAGIAVDALRNPDEEVDWAGASRQEAEATAIRTHVLYCHEIAPTQDYRVIERALQSLPIDMGGGVVLKVTGTLDRIRADLYGRQGVADLKTGATAVSADGEVAVGKHLGQLGVYQLLAEQEFGALELPSAIIGLSTGSVPRAGLREVTGAKEALIGSGTEPGLLHYAAQYFRSGLFPANSASWLCSAKFCAFYSRCRYHG